MLEVIGQAPELVAGGAGVAHMLAAGALLQIAFTAASFYLEGTGRPKPGLYAMIGANGLNVALNWLLIGGRIGAPELGAPGAALATTISRLVMVAGLLIWMLRLPDFASWRGRPLTLWGPGGWAPGAEMRRIGLAGGAAYFFETVAFAAMAQAAGLLGATPLAAYTILHNVETTVFMIALGLSVATAVHAGQAAGAGDRAGRALRRPRRALRGDGAGGAGRAGDAGRRPGGRRLLQLRSRPHHPRRAADRHPGRLHGLRRRPGRARAGDAGAGRFLGHHGLLLRRLLVRDDPGEPVLAFVRRSPRAAFIGTGLGCAAAVALLGARFGRLVARV